MPARADESSKGVAQYAGFSLHAGFGVEADQRDKLERLARYVSRSPVSVERLTTHRAKSGTVSRLPIADGTTHIVLEPLDFIARLAALVPLPRVAPDAVSWRIRGARGVARGDYAGRQKGVGEANRRAAADA